MVTSKYCLNRHNTFKAVLNQFENTAGLVRSPKWTRLKQIGELKTVGDMSEGGSC